MRRRLTWQSLLCQEMLETTRAVGATPLRKIVRHFLLQLLLGVCLRIGWAGKPLIIATARDLQHPTQATHAKLS